MAASKWFLPIAGVALVFFAACGGSSGDGSTPGSPRLDERRQTAVARGPTKVVKYDTPSFDTLDEMMEYIEERHNRVREFAAQEPDVSIHAAISLREGLNLTELAVLEETYDMERQPYAEYAEYIAGDANGGTSFSLAEQELEYRNQGVLNPSENLMVHYFTAQLLASEAVRLTRDSRVALVFADHSIDRLTGIIGQDVLVRTSSSITYDYQRLTDDTQP